MFTEHGVPVERILAGGGLIRNPFLMQVYSDVSGRDIGVAGSSEVSALGAAILAATGAGERLGGYSSITAAAGQMVPPEKLTYSPKPEAAPLYQKLFGEYRKLVDYFGRGGNPVMETLHEMKRGATPSEVDT